MKAFGATHDAIFVAPSLIRWILYADESVQRLGAWRRRGRISCDFCRENDPASGGAAYLQCGLLGIVLLTVDVPTVYFRLRN